MRAYRRVASGGQQARRSPSYRRPGARSRPRRPPSSRSPPTAAAPTAPQPAMTDSACHRIAGLASHPQSRRGAPTPSAICTPSLPRSPACEQCQMGRLPPLTRRGEDRGSPGSCLRSGLPQACVCAGGAVDRRVSYAGDALARAPNGAIKRKPILVGLRRS